MLQYDFEESVGYWVVMSAHALHRALDEELARHGITFRQWQVLAWLALEGEMAQSELAERMGIEAPTLVGILDRMERDGWIARRSCAADRRKKLIQPTQRVEPVWSKMVACAHRVRKQATQGLDP
ncbi:MAG: MarR family transcriptional regulator, partial [Planctomycetes bacterium]|nr:MarR family transcriptional regulator [Planctomycetota bacterium]